jgi:hypothetical protein
MLALLAAMTVAAMTVAAATGEARAGPAVESRPLPVFVRARDPEELAARRHCMDAARLQVDYKPALLFREQDRANARARRLIDLPQGAMCLLGGAGSETVGSR